MKTLMCEPNVSEGRDREAVGEIIAAIVKVKGVKLIDHSSDPDHNRSVLTYIGEPEAVLKAAMEMSVRAFDLIDMTRHKGSHPRIGAVDVVPFIPVRGVTIEDAVHIARQFGRFVGSRGVPVYYYESAATRPERKSLPDIRTGEYENLEAKLKDPLWHPDEGPAEFNPKSGAMVTGVRFPLIAFNVNLNTTDRAIADKIARAVRAVSGGYRFVRAIGLPLADKDLVQVSMNLTDYTKTPIPRGLETIRSEAARYGVSIAGTELVGPVPLDALAEVVKCYLQVHEFSTEQIIETALIER